MESNHRYYSRRAFMEMKAAERAVTPEAKARRSALAELFERKARHFQDEAPASRPVAMAEW